MSIRRVVSVDQAEWSIAPPPAWRLPRDPEWAFRPPAGDAVAWLLIDEQHHVATQACTRRWVRQLLSLSAVQGLSQVELEFEPDSQRLLVHELVVWRLERDGAWRQRTPVAADAFLLRQREQQLEQQMLNGRVSLVALLEDVRVGDVVDLAWTIEQRERLSGLAFTSYFAFAWHAPLAKACFTLHLDPATPVRWVLHPGGDGPLPTEAQCDDHVEWTLLAPPRFDPEPNVPGHHLHWPLLEVSGWDSWQAVATVVADLWDEALASDAADVGTEAARLAADVSPAEAVENAIRFVQEDVRYLAVDFGHGAGLLPNAAGTVLRRRFGDCKDKTVLLTALLRALGVAARPMLVASHWRKAVARLLPAAYAFDHVIVAFEWEGARCVVDPTAIGQRGTLARRVPPPFGVGLEIAPTTTAPVELPADPPSTLLLIETFELDRRGKGEVFQTLEVHGSFADDLRATLLRDGQEKFAKSRAEALQQRFPALQASTAIEVDDAPDDNRLCVRVRHGLPTWGKAGERPPPVFNYGAYGLLLGLDTLDERDARRQPWALRYPMRLHHRVVVRGRCVHRAKPGRHTQDGPGFAYRCEVQSTRRQVSFDYVWETTAAEVAAQDWPAYRSTRAAALEHTGALVDTQGMTLGRALRIGIGVMIGLVWGTQIVLRMLDDSPPMSGRDAQAAMMREVGDAFEAMRRGDATRAYALAAPHAAHYADNFEAQILLAEASMLTGHGAEAEAALTRARELKPGHTLPDIVEASLRELRGDFAGARSLLEAVIVNKDVDLKAYIDLARVTERTGDAVAARSAWERLLQRQPAHPEGLYGLAHLLWLAGERTRADEIIVGAVRSQPTPSALLEGVLARYYASTGRPADALDAARRATTLAPEDVAAARQYAMAQMNAGERLDAMRTAQGMTQRFADSPLAWSALAITAAVAGEVDVATPAFDRWIAMSPNDAEAVSSLGYFLHMQGKDARAREVLADGSARFPAYGNLWLNYAVVLEALGDPAAADARRKADSLMTAEQRATLAR